MSNITTKQSKIINLFDKIPDPITLLIGFALVATILTWIMPTGSYERELNEVTKINMVVPDSFAYQDKSYPESVPEFISSIFVGYEKGHQQGLWDFCQSIMESLVQSSYIVIYMLVVGGAMAVIMSTGAIDGILLRTVSLVQQKPKLDKVILVAIILFFAFCASTFGMTAESIFFIPILMPLCIAMGYDTIVAVAISFLTCAFGYACSTLNPFNIAVAQNIAELPLMSGLEFRIAFFIVSYTITIGFILRYAQRIKRNPELSYVSDVDFSDVKLADGEESYKITASKWIVIIALILGIALLIVGSLQLSFGFIQISAIFVAIAFISIIACKIKLEDASKTFLNGVNTIMYGALLAGLARAFLIVMENGKIMDTLVHWLVSPLKGLPDTLTAVLMMVMQGIINIFVPSGSGQAALTMPIMVPIADILEINRQIAVFAFQVGDGFGNSILPTVGVLMAALAMARIPFGRWLRFAAKLVGIQYCVGAVFCVIAVLIDYGPF